MYDTILVIPDSHAHPKYSNDRFEWLGKLITDRQPDIIIDIGDSADLPSLCKYDVGNIRAEGNRLKDDLDAYKDAMDLLWMPLENLQLRQRNNKKKQYNPIKVKTRGNHEHRLDRAAEEDPKLYGAIGTHLLNEEHYYDVVKPFLEPFTVDGISFCHYFPSGVMGFPIGGIHQSYNMVRKTLGSCVVGHSHTRDYHESARPDGSRVFGLSVGCYVDYEPDWCKTSHMWWKGAVLLHEVHDGTAEPEFISINRIKHEYSGVIV